MSKIIIQNHGKDNIETIRMADTVQVTARAKKQSNALGALNRLCLSIDLDDLAEDPEARSQQLYRMLCSKYAEEKKKFEESHDGVVRNGTYVRKFILLDPIDGKNLIVSIVMQKYRHKKDGRSETFYGGIFMPRLPYLVRQVLTILSEKDSPEAPGIHGYCLSWGITVKLYYSFLRWAMELLASTIVSFSRKDLRDVLGRLRYSL